MKVARIFMDEFSGNEIAGLGSNVFFCNAEEFEEGFMPKKVTSANVYTGKVSVIDSDGLTVDEAPKWDKPKWETQPLSVEITMSEEVRRDLRRAFPPELFRTKILSNPSQDSRPRSFTITSQKEELSPEEQTAQAYMVYLKDRGGKSYLMKHCKVECKKREYRHSNPSRYYKLKKKIVFISKI